MAEGGSKFVVYAALTGNLLIALAKFIAAMFTGSSAMLSEGFHSVVDTGNQALLLLGIKRSTAPPDALHPFGYASEIYFWSFVVAVLLFAVGAGVSTYEGIQHLRSPEPIEDPLASYIVLAIASLFEGTSWTIALREFHRSTEGFNYLAAAQRSKDPTIFMVLFEDTAALIGLVIVLIATWLSTTYQAPWIDGVGSLAIGLLLALVALFLARETKGLLMGEAIDPAVLRDIRAMIEQDSSIAAVRALRSLHLGPRSVLLAVSIDFADRLSSGELEQSAVRLERRVKERFPQISRFYLEIRPDMGGGAAVGPSDRLDSPQAHA